MKPAALPCLALIQLQGCGFDFGPQPVPGPDAETVNLVLYCSDGDFDFKHTGEWALLSTGEILQVKRNRIRPNIQFITNDTSKCYLPLLEAPTQVGFVALKLDRRNGIACLQNKCATLYALCPEIRKVQSGEQCVTFLQK